MRNLLPSRSVCRLQVNVRVCVCPRASLWADSSRPRSFQFQPSNTKTSEGAKSFSGTRMWIFSLCRRGTTSSSQEVSVSHHQIRVPVDFDLQAPSAGDTKGEKDCLSLRNEYFFQLVPTSRRLNQVALSKMFLLCRKENKSDLVLSVGGTSIRE